MAHETGMPVDLILVRHGQSEAELYDDLGRKGLELRSNGMAAELQSKLHGHHSSEWRLTDLGRHQAKRLGLLLRQRVLLQGVGAIDSFFVSSYARAMETAGYMKLPGAKYKVNVFLREKDSVREWDRSGACLPLSGGSNVSRFYGDAAGLESPADLVMRVYLFLQDLREHHRGQRIVVVCHKDILKAFHIVLTHEHPTKYEAAWSQSTPYCSIVWYTRRDVEGNVRTHYNRRVVLALKEADNGSAEHAEADISEERLLPSGNEHELTSQELLAFVREKPQSLNNSDMDHLLSNPGVDNLQPERQGESMSDDPPPTRRAHASAPAGLLSASAHDLAESPTSSMQPTE